MDNSRRGSKKLGFLKDLRITAIFLVVCVGLICASIWAYREFMRTPPYVDPATYPVKGIDVSRHNGMMNLDAAAADGIKFIFIKASEGASHRDPNFRINYDKATHAGMAVGAYHFFRFGVDGESQARNFIAAVGNRKMQLGLAIDVEEAFNQTTTTDDEVVRELSKMAEFLALNGYRVIYYTNRDGYGDYVSRATPGELWICSFSRNPIAAEWTFWQYDHHGRVAGIKGDVDLNVFCGSQPEWSNYLLGASWPYE